jgi:serine/threonine protein kinase
VPDEKEDVGTSQDTYMSDYVCDTSSYTVGRKLGAGSFGRVYLIQRKDTREQFALKLFSSSTLSRGQRSLLRELETLMQARHPGLLPLEGLSFSWSAQDPCPAIITPYLPSGSLEEVVYGRRQFSLVQKMIALYGIAVAMGYLHDELHVVHRDLKPANVLLDADLQPVVADFGLSKHVTASHMRQTCLAGSPIYMAPELLKDEEYSVKVDVYAFGILAWEVITQTPAFATITSAQELVNRTVNGLRPPLDQVPQKLRDLVTYAWDQVPKSRPGFPRIARWLKKPKCWWHVPLDSPELAPFHAYVAKLEQSAEPS